MTSATQINWKIPLTLLVVSAIPFAAGIARLAGLAGNSAITPEAKLERYGEEFLQVLEDV